MENSASFCSEWGSLTANFIRFEMMKIEIVTGIAAADEQMALFLSTIQR